MRLLLLLLPKRYHDRTRVVSTAKRRPNLLLFSIAVLVIVSAYTVKKQSRSLEIQPDPPVAGRFAAPKPRRHDRSSKFSIMTSGGALYREDRNTATNTSLTLDALSIGTQFNLGLLEAQQRTWGSAKSIRHYFAATELDDADPSCYKTLNTSVIEGIADWCKNEMPYAKGAMRIQFSQFVKGGFTKRETSIGWMCAQQRFGVALEKLGRFYRNELENDESALPDFLLIQDDDTYYNMVGIEEFLRNKDPSIPLAEAPCLIQYVASRNFSYPWGGFGFILSRGAIANLIRPIYCNDAPLMEEFDRNVCSRLQDDILGEARFFRDGMSVSDLMGTQVRMNLFTNFSRGNWSYCLHGDWALGYFVNFYYISNHIETPGLENVAEARIRGTLGSTRSNDKGNCIHRNVEACPEDAHVCHRQTAKSMANLTKLVAVKKPGVFRNYR